MLNCYCISIKSDLSQDAPTTDIAENPLPLTDVTADANKATPETEKSRAPRPPKQRGPPEDGIPSTTKVMVANLPYDLSEEKVSIFHYVSWSQSDTGFSSRNYLLPMSLALLRSPFAPSLALW